MMMIKNNQLISQLPGGGREGGGAVGGEVERQQLERSVSKREERVREGEVELQWIQLEMERVKRERVQAEATIAALEKERKEAIDAKIDANSKLAATNEELITLRNKTSSGKYKKVVEVRLNEAAGKISALVGKYEEAKAVSTPFYSLCVCSVYMVNIPYSRKLLWVKTLEFRGENLCGLPIGTVGWALLHKIFADKTFA